MVWGTPVGFYAHLWKYCRWLKGGRSAKYQVRAVGSHLSGVTGTARRRRRENFNGVCPTDGRKGARRCQSSDQIEMGIITQKWCRNYVGLTVGNECVIFEVEFDFEGEDFSPSSSSPSKTPHPLVTAIITQIITLSDSSKFPCSNLTRSASLQGKPDFHHQLCSQ